MSKNSVLKGSLLVAIGAASYGVLTTFVKMAYEEGFSMTEVTFSQLFLGFAGLSLLDFFFKRGKKEKLPEKASKSQIIRLILAGTSLGLTSIFYYSAVQYVSVSVGIVLLMQSVWMGVVLDAFVHKTMPSKSKFLTVGIILVGTLLATNVFLETVEIDLRGIGFGLLAAMSYTMTIFVSNKIAVNLPAITRSKWMLLGGFLIVALISLPKLFSGFDVGIFYKWGPILAFFGTILPPLFFTTGMPKINMGLGAIVSSLELPVAVLMAYFLLNEKVNAYQWMGIVLILFSIVIMNMKKRSKTVF